MKAISYENDAAVPAEWHRCHIRTHAPTTYVYMSRTTKVKISGITLNDLHNAPLKSTTPNSNNTMQAAVSLVQDYIGTEPTATKAPYKHREDGSTMRALAWFGKEDVRMVDAPIPDITQDTDVIVKVTGTTICGSDLHLYHSEMLGMQKGDILGHEFMWVFCHI